MLLKIHKTGAIIIILLCIGIVFSPSGQANDNEYIKYDFSSPDKVFKATINETVVKQEIKPDILFQFLKIGQLVIVNDHPNHPDIPWLTTSGILVNAPPDQVMRVICDYKNYPAMIPQVDEANSKRIAFNS